MKGLIFGEVAKRHIFDVAVDVGGAEVGVVVPPQINFKIQMLVHIDKIGKFLRFQCPSESQG